MAKIRPFSAVRPTPDLAAKVAALPYDVMNSEEARTAVQGNPYSFLHVDKAEIDLPPDTNLYDDAVYAKAKENLEQMQEEGVLLTDESPRYYLYQLTMAGRSQTGLVVTASIDDYLEGHIKKHEFTRADKEQDRIRHVDTCNAQTGPIFLAYRPDATISRLVTDWKQNHAPVYDFTTEDSIRHVVWVVDDSTVQVALTEAFAQIPSLYIADGHHRAASAVRVGQMRRTAEPDNSSAPFHYFLSVLFPADELSIMDYNRVVKDLQGQTPTQLLEAIRAAGFAVEPTDSPVHPKQANQFGMYLDGAWYTLTASPTLLHGKNSVDSLDVSLLQDHLLSPLLAIGDPRTDNRIDFIGGIRGLAELERRVNSGDWAVAFSLYPTAMEQVMEIADNNMTMPPKSTWFEPKLRSGLFTHPLK